MEVDKEMEELQNIVRAGEKRLPMPHKPNSCYMQARIYLAEELYYRHETLMASNRVGARKVVGVDRVCKRLEDLPKFKVLVVRLWHWSQPSNSSAWLSFTSNHGSQDHC